MRGKENDMAKIRKKVDDGRIMKFG